MTFEEFKKSLREDQPPSSMNANLKALWEDARGNWDKAHEIAQNTSGVNGDWIHAYLHRKEGDLGNAAYWYHKAGKAMPKENLDSEWEHLVRTML